MPFGRRISGPVSTWRASTNKPHSWTRSPGRHHRCAKSEAAHCPLSTTRVRLLQHKNLDLRRGKPAFAKARAAIETGDFKSPDVKKLHAGGHYRAKLDHSNLLLLKFARRGGETVCLAPEVIENHACDKAHLLRGAPVDEATIERAADTDPATLVAVPEQIANAFSLGLVRIARRQGDLVDEPVLVDAAKHEAGNARRAAQLSQALAREALAGSLSAQQITTCIREGATPDLVRSAFLAIGSGVECFDDAGPLVGAALKAPPREYLSDRTHQLRVKVEALDEPTRTARLKVVSILDAEDWLHQCEIGSHFQIGLVDAKDLFDLGCCLLFNIEPTIEVSISVKLLKDENKVRANLIRLLEVDRLRREVARGFKESPLSLFGVEP